MKEKRQIDDKIIEMKEKRERENSVYGSHMHAPSSIIMIVIHFFAGNLLCTLDPASMYDSVGL